MQRKVLEHESMSQPALDKIYSFHSDVVEQVIEAVLQHKVVVVGMSVNPVVKKAKNLLHQKGMEYKYLEYGSYLVGWHKRLAIKLWSGWPTYPQIFIDGKLIGGFTELKDKLSE